jgi:RimJ/RimL family protein N-acetyltransferase
VAAGGAGRLRRPSPRPDHHGPGAQLIKLETERLQLEPLAEQDLPDALDAFESNPEYLEWTDGADYGIELLRQDWQNASQSPGRHMLGIRDRDTGELAGVIEYVENNEHDGHPWIGLIIVRADRQKDGIAGEAMLAVCGHVNYNWASPVRLGVIEHNRPGLALAVSLGFQPYGEAEQEFGAGPARLILMERRA